MCTHVDAPWQGVRGEGGGNVLQCVEKQVVQLHSSLEHGLHQAAPHGLKARAKASASTASAKVLLQAVLGGGCCNLADKLVHVVLVLLHDGGVELGDAAGLCYKSV